MLEAMKLAMAIQKRFSHMDRVDRKELAVKIRKAIGDNSKVSIIEWSTIGKNLGVFNMIYSQDILQAKDIKDRRSG